MTVDEVVAYFETLAPAGVGRVHEFYVPQAYFKDPFNEVHGADAIARVYAHLFDQVRDPRFTVTERWTGTHGTVLLWDFTFRVGTGRTRTETIRGATHLRFAPDGRIVYHRDYWDAAEELYEKIPLLGALMRWLKRRVRA